MQIDLIGGTYEHKYRSWNSQRTINWMPQITDQKSAEKNKTQIALIPRPGLTQFSNISGDAVRGLQRVREAMHNQMVTKFIDEQLSGLGS